MALARHMSSEIAVVRAARVAPTYDPRSHALRKKYRYVIFNSRVRDPFRTGRAWRVEERLNHEALAEEADSLVGQHDFRAFRSSSDQRVDTVRTIFRIDVLYGSPDPDCVALEIQGDRFLHRMVRIIAGTLVDVSRGRLDSGAVKRAFSTGERHVLGITAPPDGLYLVEIDLDDDGIDNWPDHLSSR